MSINQLREQVCEANRSLVKNGLVTLTWGNVSGLAYDQDVFAIKPSGVPYEELRAEHMVVVSCETGQVVEGNLKPSSDTETHRVLYNHFDGIRGITHTHSTIATAWAQARREIPCLGTTHADHFFGPIPVTRPLTPSEVQDGYEEHTGRVIVECFTNLNPIEIPGVLVAGHAPFTWGDSAMSSLENSIALESIAKMAQATLTVNENTIPLEVHVCDKHFLRKHGEDAYYGQK